MGSKIVCYHLLLLGPAKGPHDPNEGLLRSREIAQHWRAHSDKALIFSKAHSSLEGPLGL